MEGARQFGIIDYGIFFGECFSFSTIRLSFDYIGVPVIYAVGYTRIGRFLLECLHRKYPDDTIILKLKQKKSLKVIKKLSTYETCLGTRVTYFDHSS